MVPMVLHSTNSRAQPYKITKGVPSTGITATNIRPLTNKDYSNAVEYKPGLPRPLRHYRRGTFTADTFASDPSYANRFVRSAGRSGAMVGIMQDRPGGYHIRTTPPAKGGACDDSCKGIGVVSSWQATRDITTKPVDRTMNPVLCCNAQKNARARTRAASTLTKPTYFSDRRAYLQSRCSTFEQRQFNFERGAGGSLYVAQCRAGSEIYEASRQTFMTSLLIVLWENDWISKEQYDYVLNASPSMEQFVDNVRDLDLEPEQRAQLDAIAARILSNMGAGNIFSIPSLGTCRRVYYKPSNGQYSTQGGVSSSAKVLRTKVNSIECGRECKNTMLL